jgi:uncharacterized protein (TIGR03435 family)
MSELSILVQATVVLALALIAARVVARRAPAAIRALLLSSAFPVLLLLPIAAFTVPQRRIEIPIAYTAPSGILFVDDAGLRRAVTTRPAASNHADNRLQFTFPSTSTLLRASWASGCLLFMIPVLVSLLRLRRLRRGGLPWTAGAALTQTLARQDGVRRRIDVFVHEALAAPMTCGLFRPAIGLPLDAQHWDETALRQALAHELEHVRRIDWPIHVICRLVCAIYWFHPLAWIAWRQRCLECERACDDAVLRTSDRTAYAEQLVQLARRLSQHADVPMLSMADRSNLATRVAALLDGTVARGRARGRHTAAILLTAVALVAAIAPFKAVIAPIEAVTRSAAASLRPAAPQAGNAGREFEVAAIRPSPPGATRDLGGCCAVRFLPGGRLSAINVGLVDLIVAAYRVQYWQVSGGPEWSNPDMLSTKDRYNIEAKAEGDASPEQMRQMQQRLLADRFQLAVRRETRTGKTYELIVEPGGHRLQPLAIDTDGGSRLRGGGGRILAEQMTMPELATYLQGQVQTVVSDRTGLTGIYRFNVQWTPDAFRLTGVGAPGNNGEPGIDPDGPSLFDALREQIGLRLRETTGPIDHFVIERAERPADIDVPPPHASERTATPPAAQAPPQAAASPRTFDVASVRRNTSGEQLMQGPIVYPGGRLAARNIIVRVLIASAYGVPFNRVTGGPDWINSDRFDIEGQAGPEASQADIRAMVQALLVERFRLASHSEARDMPIFALMPARSDGTLGPALRQSGPECAPITPPRSGPPLPPPPPASSSPEAGVPLLAPGTAPVRCGRMFFGGFIAARQITMADFATSLAMFAGRPVVDRTNLTGAYDLDLTFAPRPPGAVVDPPADGPPSIFTALSEQLGLKLEPDRGPVEMLVIDRVEPPTAN